MKQWPCRLTGQMKGCDGWNGHCGGTKSSFRNLGNSERCDIRASRNEPTSESGVSGVRVHWLNHQLSAMSCHCSLRIQTLECHGLHIHSTVVAVPGFALPVLRVADAAASGAHPVKQSVLLAVHPGFDQLERLARRLALLPQLVARSRPEDQRPRRQRAAKGRLERFKKLCDSLRDFPAMMELRPIVVDKDYTVLGGNMRVRACQALGMKEIPASWVSVADKLTPEQTRRFVVEDNIGFGEWDFDALANEFDVSELEAFGFDMDKIPDVFDGNGADDDADPNLERAEELQKAWRVGRGQLWLLGHHRLVCGDSSNQDAVRLALDGMAKPCCVFTDPPYGIAIGEKNKFLNTFQKAGRCLNNIANDCLGKDELFDLLVRVFTLTRESCSDHCSYYVCAPQGGEMGMMMMMMMIAAGMPTRHVLIWAKNAPTFSMGRLDYEYQHEPILFAWTKHHHHFGKGDFNTSVWTVDKPRENKLHPTMKPKELFENAYMNSSRSSDVVYDPFVGSGTAFIAAENTGRVCAGLDVDPKYVAVTLQRFQDATGKTPVLRK